MPSFDVPQIEHDTESVDPWFATLDRRHMPDGAGGWMIEVNGIHRNDRDTWVQIGTSEDPEETVLLHVSPWGSPDDALAALRAWSCLDVSRRPRVIEVMRPM
jgi:hypothetical protein